MPVYNTDLDWGAECEEYNYLRSVLMNSFLFCVKFICLLDVFLVMLFFVDSTGLFTTGFHSVIGIFMVTALYILYRLLKD